MRTIGYAVAGTGYSGARPARVVEEQEGARVMVVYDPKSAGIVATELGCDVETDLGRLYSRGDTDAVIVASPNYLHREPIVKAVGHGVYVFCERPTVLSYQDCVEMVKTCAAHNVTLVTSHVVNFFGGVHTIKKMTNGGAIGKVLYCHPARNGREDTQPSVSWKKIRAKLGGHLYHHIHEPDCIQFLMSGRPDEVTMAGDNVAHCGEQFGDEDSILLTITEHDDNWYAILEYDSVFHWSGHHVSIQGAENAVRLDMLNYGGVLKKGGKEEHSLTHKTQKKDGDHTRIYHGAEMDGAIMYGKPGKRSPMWFHGIVYDEMEYSNHIMRGAQPDEESEALFTGEVARNTIATADACTRSQFENRKVRLSEITGVK